MNSKTAKRLRKQMRESGLAIEGAASAPLRTVTTPTSVGGVRITRVTQPLQANEGRQQYKRYKKLYGMLAK